MTLAHIGHDMQALDVAVIRCKVRGRGAPIWPLQVNGEEP